MHSIHRVLIPLRLIHKLMLLLAGVFVLALAFRNSLPGSISVSIIADVSPRSSSRPHSLGHSHAMNFVQRIFSDVNVDQKVTDRKIWRPIYTDPCPGTIVKDKFALIRGHNEPGFNRGMLLAHRQIWDEFVWANRDILPNITTYESPKMVVFEHDAMEIDPRAPDLAYQAVTNMTADLLYLGHCFATVVMPPVCLHAYALTVDGARKLLGSMDWCARSFGGVIDMQIQELAGVHKALSWEEVPASCPYGICDDYIQNQSLQVGFTIQYGNRAGGLFHQVIFEDLCNLVEDGLFMAKWPAKTVYLYRNATFHEFPSLQTFAAMGCDRTVGCFDFNEVVVVPEFRLKKNIGDPVPPIHQPCACLLGGNKQCKVEGYDVILDGLRTCN